MNQYKVLIACPINGTDRVAGDVVELDTEVADALVASGNLELVEEGAAPAAPAGQVATPQGVPAPVQAPARLVHNRTLAVTPLSQDDIDANPLLVELGAVVGDLVALDKAAN